MSEAEVEVEESIAALFAKHRHTVLERIGVVVDALRALANGGVSDDDRQEAFADAHALHGSLGSFGYPEGSVLAAAAETALETNDGWYATRLADDLADFASAIDA